METEREALLVVREVVTRRLVTVTDARLRFQEWRRRSASGSPETFLDYLVAYGCVDGPMRQKIVLAMAMSAADPDARAEENIRTMVLGQPPVAPAAPALGPPTPQPPPTTRTPPPTRTPAPTPPATTPAPHVRATASGRLVPVEPQEWGEVARSASGRVRAPGAGPPTPGPPIPSSLTPSTRTPGSRTPGSMPRPAGAPPREEGEVELVTPGGAPIGLEPPVGTRLGNYELVEVVGRGGMGTVFKARVHPTLDVVAVKVLGGNDRRPSPARRARFRREVLATARLAHDNVVRVRDAGHAGGIDFMVMELVDGEDLERALALGKLSLPERLEVGTRVVAGVAHAHERGVIHRDLKPQNVLLSSSGVPKVMDFGLAKLEEEDNRLTRTGSALGTPYYMAPEQFIAASTVDARADVFSLGVLLYELLTTEKPFKGGNAVEVADRVRNLDPTPPSLVLPGISRKVDAVVLRAMAKKPDARYVNAGELLADLEKARAGADTAARAASSATYAALAGGPVAAVEERPARSYRAPAFGFVAACVVFVPVIVLLGRKGAPGTDVPAVVVPVTPPSSATATSPPPPPAPPAPPSVVPAPPPRPPVEPAAQSAIDKARAELAAVAAPAAVDLPADPERSTALSLELESAFFAPVAVGDVARARAGVDASRVIAKDVRAELHRELVLLEKLRALVLSSARADPGALGDRIDAWGGARDLGRYPRVLEDETIDLRVETHTACVRPLALSGETLAHATGADAGSLRALAVLALARGESLPAGLPAADEQALRALASWREGARPIARTVREAQARAAWDEVVRGADPETWATRFADTAFFAEQRREWGRVAAERLGADKLLGAIVETAKNRVRWDCAESHLLAFDVAFVSTLVRVDRMVLGLDLAGVRIVLDAGRARSVGASLENVKGRVGFSLGRHALALDERGRPAATVAGEPVAADDEAADWRQAHRLEAVFQEHDRTRVLDAGSPVVMFKADQKRLAKVRLDATPPAGTPTFELALDAGRLRVLDVVSFKGAFEEALPRLAEMKLAALGDRRRPARLLRSAADRFAGLRLEGVPGTWKLAADGALEAVGPTRLVAFVPVETGAALLALDATPGVTLGWGEPSFPAPVTEKGSYKKLALVATAKGDALTVDDLVRVPAARTGGARCFVIRVEAGARAAVRGLEIASD